MKSYPINRETTRSRSMRVPKYRLHKGSGQALVEWKGQRHYLGVYGTPESRQRYRQFVAEALREPLPAPEEQTVLTVFKVNDLCVRFLAWAETYYIDPEIQLPSSEFDQLRFAAAPLFQTHAETLLEQFGPRELKEVRDEMVRRNWARTHINHQVQRLRRIFRWGVENGLVPPATLEALRCVAPLRRGRSNARESIPVKPADDAAIEATLPLLSHQVAAMVRLQRVSGMRSQNLCRMRAGDIDTSQEIARGIWILRPDRHKTSHTGRELEIALGPNAQAILRPFYLRRKPEEHVFSPADSLREHHARRRAARKTKVQPSQVNRSVPYPSKKPGSKYTTRSYRRAICRAVDAYNAQVEREEDKIERWTPHRLRHSRGTEVRSKYGLEAAQVILGHTRADVTQIYAERDAELAAKVARETG